MIVTWWITRGAIIRFRCERKTKRREKKQRNERKVPKFSRRTRCTLFTYHEMMSRIYYYFYPLLIGRNSERNEWRPAARRRRPSKLREGAAEEASKYRTDTERFGRSEFKPFDTRGVPRRGGHACRSETAIFAYAPSQNPSDAHEYRVSQVP